MKTAATCLLFVLLCLLTVVCGATLAVSVNALAGGGGLGLLLGLAAAVVVGWAASPLLAAVVDA